MFGIVFAWAPDMVEWNINRHGVLGVEGREYTHIYLTLGGFNYRKNDTCHPRKAQ